MNYVRLAFLQTVAVIAILLLIIAYVWWHHTGWVEFGPFTTGQVPSWAPTNAKKNSSRLRFKDCVFSVKRSGDVAVTTQDVTGVLNAMSRAYMSGNYYDQPAKLVLTRPLNAFSFIIPGFNDAATTIAGIKTGTVSDPTAAPWCTRAPIRGATCTTDATCGGDLGSCTGWPGIVIGEGASSGCKSAYDCAEPGATCASGACSKGTLKPRPKAGDKCAQDWDCDYVYGSCQGGKCTDIPSREGQCKTCASDGDCGLTADAAGKTLAGVCTNTPVIAATPTSVAQPARLGVCSICPGAAVVTLTGFVRAI